MGSAQSDLLGPLLAGYRAFRSDLWDLWRDRYKELARTGQRPQVAVIACSDARLDPQALFGAAPGELFVIRNVAALVPPYRRDVEYSSTGAALEFAVRTLGVRLIVVLSHSHCGGIRALIDGMPDERGEFVTPWVQIAASALEAVPDHLAPAEHLSRCEAEVARLSLANLQTYPWVLDAVTGEEVGVEALRFDTASGVLSRLNSGGFSPLD